MQIYNFKIWIDLLYAMFYFLLLCMKICILNFFSFLLYFFVGSSVFLHIVFVYMEKKKGKAMFYYNEKLCLTINK